MSYQTKDTQELLKIAKLWTVVKCVTKSGTRELPKNAKLWTTAKRITKAPESRWRNCKTLNGCQVCNHKRHQTAAEDCTTLNGCQAFYEGTGELLKKIKTLKGCRVCNQQRHRRAAGNCKTLNGCKCVTKAPESYPKKMQNSKRLPCVYAITAPGTRELLNIVNSERLPSVLRRRRRAAGKIAKLRMVAR